MASEPVSASAAKTTRRRAIIALLVVPLLAVPLAASLLLANNGGSAPAVERRGTFHPVAGSFEPDSTTLDECEDRYSCLEQAFGNIAFRGGAKRALSLFESSIETNAHVERDCHRIVHTIGSAVYERNDRNVAKTFSQGSAICASGFYHGILERAFLGATTTADLQRLAGELCVDLDIRRRSFFDYQCRHGLGHGLMIQTGYHLPTALAVCESLGTRWDEVTCTSGVFMENVSTRFGFRSPWLDEERPLAPCDGLRPRHRRSCYVRATTWVLQLVENDFGRAAQTCLSAGAEWARFCMRGLGRDAVVESKYADKNKTLALCRHAGRYFADCVYGAARTFSDGAALDGVRRAASFCTRVPASVRSSCVEGFGLVVGLLRATPKARRAVCRSLAPGYVRACTRAAAEEVHPSGKRAWG
jgi:hypothetical protein